MSDLQVAEQKVGPDKFVQSYIAQSLAKNNEQIARDLGITERHLYRLKKKYRPQLMEAVHDHCKDIAIKHIHYLDRNGERGDTRSSLAILQMADIYVPKSKTESDNRVTVNVVHSFPTEQPEQQVHSGDIEDAQLED